MRLSKKRGDGKQARAVATSGSDLAHLAKDRQLALVGCPPQTSIDTVGYTGTAAKGADPDDQSKGRRGPRADFGLHPKHVIRKRQGCRSSVP